MAATEGKLGELHDAVAEALTNSIQGEPTPQMLAVAVKFLKDNGIEALPTENNKLGKLSDALPQFDNKEALRDRPN